jgi:hypothetical protein
MKNRSCKEEGTNGRSAIKEGSKDGEYDWYNPIHE